LGRGCGTVAGDVRGQDDDVVMPVEPHLDAWLAELSHRGGTDILLTAGSAPFLRVDGRLLPLEGGAVLNSEEVERITRAQLPGHHYQDNLQVGRELDFSFTWRDEGRVRANAFYQRGQCSLSLRYFPMRIPSPEELGLPPAVMKIIHSPSGLVLVTGPTGAGKSTSMASMIDAVNRSRRCHIITIEDPIEYLHTNQLAAVSQREVGTDTESFEAALRSALREDPDVVLVGEMRDLESIAACLTIAETGHLVIATLHTNDSAQALDRIIDVFPADRRPQIQVQLAGTLLAVVYQRLLAKRSGGLVAAYEVMVGVAAVRNLIREGKTRQLRNILVTHRADGMQTLEWSLTELVNAGLIDYESATEASLFPRDIPKPVGLPPAPRPPQSVSLTLSTEITDATMSPAYIGSGSAGSDLSPSPGWPAPLNRYPAPQGGHFASLRRADGTVAGDAGAGDAGAVAVGTDQRERDLSGNGGRPVGRGA
jgi:twitching motility protein PilT